MSEGIVKQAAEVQTALDELRRTSGPMISGAVELLMKSPRRDQLEMLAYQVQHLVHGMNRVAMMQEHIHNLVCPIAREELANGIEPDEDDRATHGAPSGRQ